MPSAAEITLAMNLKGSAQATYVSLLKQQDQAQAQAEANRPRTPTRTADSLASTQYATFLDLLSEGEIEGFPSAAGLTKGTTAYNIAALKDIYLNKTAILRATADLNNVQPVDYSFQNVTIEPRYGTQAQTYIQGYGDISEPVQVNSVVQQATPVTRTVTDVNVNGVVITITVPALQEFNSQGDILGSSFSFTIALSYAGGAFTTVATETISGRTADSYQRDYRVDFTTGWTSSVAIKITRTTADSTDPATLVNAFQWTYYQEITYQKLTYPNSAIVAIKFDAQQFSSLPSRSYRIRGVKVRVPTGITVDQTNGRIIYPGGYTFNGTLTAENARVWTSDPAWILFDLLTNTRYGFGQHIADAQLDKPAFYAASAYASTLVSDGFNSTEPRFSCNVLIQNQDDAYKLINDLSSVMRVMPYWATGAVTISQDSPRDASYLFTMANVTEAGFSYAGSSLKTRHTVAVVTYLDTQTQDIAYEVVEDAAGIAKYGVNKTELRAFACTSRGQAARLGYWVLHSGANETEVVTFAASVESGVLVRPGQVIKIADPLKAGIRRAGRISAATTTQITVDNTSSTDLTNLFNAKLTVIMPDGSIEERTITTVVNAVITVSTAFSTTPNVGSIWMLQNTDVEATTWRVLTVTESNNTEYSISALAHNPSKYAYVEQNRPLQNPNISVTELSPEPPVGINSQEVFYVSNNRATSKIVVRWQPVRGVGEYRIQWKRGDGNWNLVDSVSAEYEILEADIDTYYIRVYSLNPLRIPSTDYEELIVTTVGKTEVPADVSDVSLVPINESSAILSWARSTELDVLVGGKVLIRHSKVTAGATWGESQEIVPSAAGNQTQKQVPLLNGSYLLKFEDDGGRRSTNATVITADLTIVQSRLTIKNVNEEDYNFTGSGSSLTNMIYNAGYDAIIIVDSFPLYVDEGYVNVNYVANKDPVYNGEYNLGLNSSNPLDLGATYDINIQRRIASAGFSAITLWDSQTELIDTWQTIDGTAVDKVSVAMYVRYTTDNPASSPVWSSWREFSNAIVRGRGLQFKIIAATEDIVQNIQISQLGVLVELQQRVEVSAILTTGAAAYNVTYTKAFYAAPSIGITPYDLVHSEDFTITSVTRTGFTIAFKQGASFLARSFTYTAVGFGGVI
jgi:predicted phage tail protein